MQRTFKSSRQLTINKVYRKWEEWTTGDLVVGKIIGHHTDRYNKKCRIIEVEVCSFKKDAKKYEKQNLVLNSSGMLDKALLALEGEEIGQYIQVEYKGTATIEKGPFAGKEAHIMDVQIVEEETDEVEL